MRLLVCGSRDWTDAKLIKAELLSVRPTEVIHGAARGADILAGLVARSLGIPVVEYPANWREHGHAAGPIRNRVMLEAKPDAVVAFKDRFDDTMRSGGTEHMVSIALRAGVPVKVVSHDAQR